MLASSAWSRDPFALRAPQGSIDKRLVQRALDRSMQRVTACGEASVQRTGSWVPKVEVEFVIDLDGKVRDAKLKGAAPADSRYGECLLEVVRALDVKGKPTGGPVTITYPFIICGVGY